MVKIKAMPGCPSKPKPCAFLLLFVSYVVSAQAPSAPDAKNNEFDPALRALKAPSDPPPVIIVPDIGDASLAGVDPKAFHLPDVPLNPTARSALGLSQSWGNANTTPLAGADGRVVFTYGDGLPTLVCSPLKICVIELEPGEKITGEPQIGDSVRWVISPSRSGEGRAALDMIVVKPKVAGLDTTLLVTTDRRPYYVRLISKKEGYVARMSFAYPDRGREWQGFVAQEAQARNDSLKLSPNAVDSMDFDYAIKGGNQNIRPVRVFDDGVKTYIEMTPNAANREAPILVVLGSHGAQEIVNYRVHGSRYIVDRLFEKAELIVGSGRSAQRVSITRGKITALATNP